MSAPQNHSHTWSSNFTARQEIKDAANAWVAAELVMREALMAGERTDHIEDPHDAQMRFYATVSKHLPL